MKLSMMFTQEEKETIQEIAKIYDKIENKTIFDCDNECQCCPFCNNSSDCAIVDLREGMEALMDMREFLL